MALLMIITSFFMCNQIVKADDVSLETGLYVYIGSETAGSDEDLTRFHKAATVAPNRGFSIVYIENDGELKKTVIYKDDNKLTFSSGLTLSVASYGEGEFVYANADKGGDYTITYNDPSNLQNSVTITVPEKMSQGLYIYNGKESPIEDSDSSHYLSSKEYGVNNDARVLLVYVDQNGSKRMANRGTISIEDNDLNCKETENSDIIFSSSKIKEYTVKYKNGETVTNYSVTLKFTSSDGSLATLDIDGNKYYFGLVDWSGKNDGTENAFMVSYRPFDQTGFVFKLPSAFVGTTRLQANDSVANQNIMNCITNVRVTLDGSSTIDSKAVQITYKENTKANVFGVNCEWFELSIDSNYYGSAIIKTEFDFTVSGQTTTLTSYQKYEVVEYQDNIINLTEGEMSASAFDYYFNPDPAGEQNRKTAYDKLEELLHKTVDRKKPQNIVVILPKGTFTGMYHINLQDYIDTENQNSITFRGYTDENGIATTIKGGFVVNGGRVKFENLKMEGNMGTPYSDNSGRNYSGKKVGIIAEKINPNNGAVADIPWIFHCSFKDYNYALISTEKGVVASCNYNYFENNDYCFYMDCKGTMFSTGADGNYGNIFVNSKIATIALMSTPSNKPFDVKFNKNLFFNNNPEAADFYVEEDGTPDKKACYLMMYNYYGRVLGEDGNSVTAENIRSARVNYGRTINAIVYTNPCLMFPLYQNINRYNNEEDIHDRINDSNGINDSNSTNNGNNSNNSYMMDGVLGLDKSEGLFSCAMNKVRIALNGSAKNNLTQFEILELRDNGVVQLGGLRNE